MRLTQLTTIAAVAGVIAAPLSMSSPAALASTDATSSAYAIAARGAAAIPATPAVFSAAEQATRKSLVEVPANPLVKASVLSASAKAGHARASVADLKAAQLGLAAHLITAKCENGVGASNLVKVVLNGHVLKAGARPNSAVSVPLDKLGTVSVVLNKQVRDASGRLTVTALELNAPLGPGKVETISIASATCGQADEAPRTPAPMPTPVPGDLPVTG
jgi:hypothetical protein